MKFIKITMYMLVAASFHVNSLQAQEQSIDILTSNAITNYQENIKSSLDKFSFFIRNKNKNEFEAKKALASQAFTNTLNVEIRRSKALYKDKDDNKIIEEANTNALNASKRVLNKYFQTLAEEEENRGRSFVTLQAEKMKQDLLKKKLKKEKLTFDLFSIMQETQQEDARIAQAEAQKN